MITFQKKYLLFLRLKLQRAVSTTIRKKNRDYWTGTVYTTNRKVWEHDIDFKKYLKKIRAMAIDMEKRLLFLLQDFLIRFQSGLYY